MSSGDGTRVGHAERDAVIAILREAAAEGRLEIEELEERIEATLAARTFADLDPLVADLPVPPPSQAGRSGGVVAVPPAGVMARPAGVPPAPGAVPHDPLRLDAGWSTVRREGAWDLPPFVRIDSAVGSVKLDCRQARPLAEVITIECVAGMGSITIVVPEGWAADLARLSSSWGSAKSKIPTSPVPGMPLLVLHGGVGMSTLTIRNESWWDSKD